MSNFLDPNFGLDAFDNDKKPLVKERVKVLLKQMSVSVESTINKDIKSKKIVETRHKN